METLGITLRWEMMILLVVLIVLVGYKLMVRQINTDGLMLDKTSGRSFSPARLQMLAVTMTIAIYYMFLVFDAEDTGRMPDLPITSYARRQPYHLPGRQALRNARRQIRIRFAPHQ
jgi:hypothetical protein